MKCILVLWLGLFVSSCEDYTNWNLPISEISSGNVCGNLQSCTITSITNNQTFLMDTNPGPYKIGDEYKIDMSPFSTSSSNFGQAKNVSLYCNEDLVHSFGDWLLFSQNNREFKIPNDIDNGYCFTIRVFKESSSPSRSADDVWVSSKFAIE